MNEFGLEKVVRILGARQHNLKNISVTLPRNRFIVLTGVSGSGKSTLAFDVMHAEGQRRYLEAFLPVSKYGMLSAFRKERPDVDAIEGLCPTVAIEQKRFPPDPRSTVGIVTEIYDFLRILFARLGTMVCPECNVPIRAHTLPEMVQEVMRLPRGSRILVLGPLGSVPSRRLARIVTGLRKEGFARVRIDERVLDLDPLPPIPRRDRHRVDVVVDRIVIREGVENRVGGSLELALRYGKGSVTVAALDGPELYFSQQRRCARCGRQGFDPDPLLFSFFHPSGACPACQGTGVHTVSGRRRKRKMDVEEDRTFLPPCPDCGGTRLRPEAQWVRLAGVSVRDVVSMSLEGFSRWIQSLRFDETAEKVVASRPVEEIERRTDTLIRLGLHYLTLDRSVSSLSSGEAQRLRLAQQFSIPLSGILYILDEPTAGLHVRDHRRVLDAVLRLKDAGNTVLVIEHDPATVKAADHVVELGPVGGLGGGEVLFNGRPEAMMRSERSVTGRYLSGAQNLGFSSSSDRLDGCPWMVLSKARGRNLKEITVRFPVGCLTCVTGVSGSGKTSLVVDTLFPVVKNRISKSRLPSLPYGDLSGWEAFRKVLLIDRNPIGRTPRSTPATYTGTFDLIRSLFSRLPEARARGYGSQRFSFNTPGGRCESCQGEGVQRVDMAFLPEVSLTCPACGGSRYQKDVLEIRFKGRSIADVLEMTVQEALDLFRHLPAIRSKLKVLQEVGLGYIRLGQPASTLSGGEAQRVKLARELGRRMTGQTLIIMDEPTVGLHMEDVEKLLGVLRRLVREGHTVIVIEHQLDFIRCSDYVIDLGPEGGPQGGWIVAEGTPKEVAGVSASHTGRALEDSA